MTKNHASQTIKVFAVLLLAIGFVVPAMAATQPADQTASQSAAPVSNQVTTVTNTPTDTRLAMNMRLVRQAPDGFAVDHDALSPFENIGQTPRLSTRSHSSALGSAVQAGGDQLIKQQSPFASVGY